MSNKKYALAKRQNLGMLKAQATALTKPIKNSVTIWAVRPPALPIPRMGSEPAREKAQPHEPPFDFKRFSIMLAAACVIVSALIAIPVGMLSANMMASSTSSGIVRSALQVVEGFLPAVPNCGDGGTYAIQMDEGVFYSCDGSRWIRGYYVVDRRSH